MNIIVALVVAFYAIYLLVYYIPLLQSGNRKHIWPWLIITGAALVLQLAYELGANLPGPTKPITDLVTGLFPIK